MRTLEELLEEYVRPVFQFHCYYKYQFYYILRPITKGIPRVLVQTDRSDGPDQIYRADMKSKMTLNEILIEAGIETISKKGKCIYEKDYE